MRVLVSSPVVVLLFLDLRGFLVPLGAPRLYGTGFANTEVEDCEPKLGASDGKTRAAEGAAIRIVASRHNFCSLPNTGRIAQRQDRRHLQSWSLFHVADESKPDVELRQSSWQLKQPADEKCRSIFQEK